MSLLRWLPNALTRHLILSRMTCDTSALQHVVVQAASSKSELLDAAKLVHDSFVARGILKPHETGLHFRPHSAAPTVRAFVASEHERVIGTVSFVEDSSDGLPMDAVYADELAPLRAQGERLVEVGALAVEPRWRKTGLVLLLNKLMVLTAMAAKADRMVIAVHPDAEVIYRETLCFERIGPVRSYPGLNRAGLSIAMMSPRLDQIKSVYYAHFEHLGDRPANSHWLYFNSSHPQLRLPAADRPSAPASSAARRAVLRARPDVVASRRSLLSTGELALTTTQALSRAAGAR